MQASILLVHDFVAVAERVLAKRVVTLFGTQLLVLRPPDPCTVQLSNVPNTVKGAELKMFFSNEELTSGGPIRTMEVDPSTKTAVITFHEASSMSSLQRLFRISSNTKLLDTIDNKVIVIVLQIPFVLS